MYFDPEAPPPEASRSEWEKVKAKWDELEAARMAVGAQSPGVFALMEHGGTSLEDVAKSSPQQTRNAVGSALDAVLDKIAETEASLGGDLDWRELGAVHRQLFAGFLPPSGRNWSDLIMKSVAQDVVEDYEDEEWWTSIGLATLAAAAFVFSELATGGLATVLWASAGVGAGVAQAAISWERVRRPRHGGSGHCEPRDRAGHARIRCAPPASRRSSTPSSRSLMLPAPARRSRRVARSSPVPSGRSAPGAPRLQHAAPRSRRWRPSLPAERALAVETSVRELGAVEAIRRSGRSADELAEIVGRDSDAGKRLLSQATVSDAKGALGWVEQVKHAFRTHAEAEAALDGLAKLERDAADAAVANAIDVLGPARTLDLAGGWQRLVEHLGTDSVAGRRLTEWRDGIAEELVAEFGDDAVIRTGSVGKFSNDLDISTLGANAAGDRERVRSWLAARVGCSPDALHDLLKFDIFTDPRRMHLADLEELGIDAELRERLSKQQAARQEQLVMSRRVYDARQAGDQAAVTALEEEMAELGITEVRDFRPLTGGERERVGSQIDSLHADLQKAVREGDTGRVTALVDEIADRQALLNASEGGGYFTGGGTRRYVQ